MIIAKIDKISTIIAFLVVAVYVFEILKFWTPTKHTLENSLENIFI